jgi:hypothetical protein
VDRGAGVRNIKGKEFNVFLEVQPLIIKITINYESNKL